MSALEDNPAVLTTVYGDSEALVIRSLLESRGISCIFRTHVAHSVHPFTVDGAGMVTILVSQDDLNEALRLLEEQDKETHSGDEQPNSDSG